MSPGLDHCIQIFDRRGQSFLCAGAFRCDVIPGAGEVSLLTAHLCDPHVCRSRLLYARFDGREAGRPEHPARNACKHRFTRAVRHCGGAVRANIVSFPSQIPTLLKQPSADMQWRVVLLFFVRGWSASRIGARFNVPRHRIWKTLNSWSVRALALGYVQVIDPEAFAAVPPSGRRVRNRSQRRRNLRT